MPFSFPHKTEEQYAEQFNSYGRLYGIIPVYFSLTRDEGGWNFEPPENVGEVVMQEAPWVPRWVFLIAARLLAWRLVSYVFTGKTYQELPLTWHRWAGADRANDPDPFEDEDIWGV